MKKAFTLIEMTVSVAIVALLSVVAVVSLAPAQQSVSTTTGADEVKALLEELKSYGVGPAQERAVNYVLLFQGSPTNPGPQDFSKCNAGFNGSSPYKLQPKHYFICYTFKKNLTGTNLNTDFYYVRGGKFNANIDYIQDITGQATITNGAIAFNTRTYDHALGYGLKYFDSGATADQTIQVRDTKQTYSKNIIVDPILNLVKMP